MNRAEAAAAIGVTTSYIELLKELGYLSFQWQSRPEDYGVLLEEAAYTVWLARHAQKTGEKLEDLVKLSSFPKAEQFARVICRRQTRLYAQKVWEEVQAMMRLNNAIRASCCSMTTPQCTS